MTLTEHLRANTDEPERFLSEVESNYVDKNTGERKSIEVNIVRMFRRKGRQLDPKTGKMIWGEYLTWEEDWFGVDFLGVKIAPAAAVIQGMWYEQEKEPNIETDQKGRPRITGYVRKGEHPVYDIPFSKKKVEEIFAKSDTDPSMVKFYAMFGSDPNLVGIRNGGFTYRQFVESTWEELYKLVLQGGGPQGIARLPPAVKIGDGVG